MKIVTIIGARPQFIKVAVLSREFAKNPSVYETIVHTGQHFDNNMSKVFFTEMQIPKPNYNLNINGMTHGAMTGQMLEKIEGVLLLEKPDWVLVYGDTNSTLAGALAASKMHINVAHVEAGLRSFNMKMPEEINRIITDRISNVLFCPTDQAVKNLNAEGFNGFNCKIEQVGDVMQEAAIYYSDKAKPLQISLPNDFVLCTLHREENSDDSKRLMNIISVLEKVSSITKIVFPLHPRTKNRLSSLNYDFSKSNILFIPPVGYLEMVYLLKNCKIVMTDSGGVQKEAYFFNKFCITLRDETEWIELVHNNYNFLTGDCKSLIIKYVNELLNRDFPSDILPLYGKGDSAKMILKTLINS